MERREHKEAEKLNNSRINQKRGTIKEEWGTFAQRDTRLSEECEKIGALYTQKMTGRRQKDKQKTKGEQNRRQRKRNTLPGTCNRTKTTTDS